MRYVKGPSVLAAASVSYLAGGLGLAAVLLVVGVIAAVILAAGRRRDDSAAARRGRT
jgi:hypothetical protein